MTITLNGDTGITSPNDTTGNQSYTGTLTGGTGIVNLGSGQFYKDASGNVGIGTSSPAALLDVDKNQNALTGVRIGNSNAGSSSLSRLLLVSDSGNIQIKAMSSTNTTYGAGDVGVINCDTMSGGLRFAHNDVVGMTLDSSNNVGIGTSTPSSKLTVLGSTSTLGQLVSSGSACYLEMDNSGGSVYIGSTGNNMQFLTGAAGTERMRIDSSGNLLVGTTSGASFRQRLYCNGFTNNGIVIATTDNASGFIYASFKDQTDTTIGSITRVGTTSVVSYATSSDYRLKKSIAPMTGALAKVALLKPCTYKWKADGSDGQGFIAHELAEVVPDCVTGKKDAVDKDGNPKYQGVDTSFLVATLTAAIQELNAKFEEYKASHP